jgi:CDP-diacylglycerol--glycerol-3-phosphate 3-phosphatidyltransferase
MACFRAVCFLLPRVVRMNLPNKLTVARFILTVVFVVLFYLPLENHVGMALLVFIAAALTDLADGKIARARGLVTNFGKLMDPLADKVLMTAALVLLAVPFEDSVQAEYLLPAWIVIAVLAREFFVTGIRVVAANNGVILAAEKLGKHKMVWQVITTIYFLMVHASLEPACRWLAPVFAWKPLSPGIFGVACLIMMTGLTLVSGFSYFWKNRKMFADA